MGFSRQESWRGLPFPSTGDLPDPGIAPESLTSFALAGGIFSTSTTREVQPVDYQKTQKAESKPITYGKVKPLSQHRADWSQEDSFLQLDSAGQLRTGSQETSQEE